MQAISAAKSNILKGIILVKLQAKVPRLAEGGIFDGHYTTTKEVDSLTVNNSLFSVWNCISKNTNKKVLTKFSRYISNHIREDFRLRRTSLLQLDAFISA